MRVGNRPGWAWFSPKDAPWWSPAAVHYALLTDRISPVQVSRVWPDADTMLGSMTSGSIGSTTLGMR